MDLTFSNITGDINLSDGAQFTKASVKFTLSGFDSQVGSVVSPPPTIFVLDAGLMPPGAKLWQNVQGLRGTYYSVSLRVEVPQTSGHNKILEYDIGRIQVGEDPSYNIADLLANPVPDAPGWNVNLDPVLYAALLASNAETIAVRDQLLVFISEDATGATLAVGDAVLISETVDPYASVTIEVTI